MGQGGSHNRRGGGNEGGPLGEAEAEEEEEVELIASEPCVKPSRFRIVVFQEDRLKGNVFLFDSSRLKSHESPHGGIGGDGESSGGKMQSPSCKSLPSPLDSKLLSELMLGSLPLRHRDEETKLHHFPSFGQMLLTKLFALEAPLWCPICSSVLVDGAKLRKKRRPMRKASYRSVFGIGIVLDMREGDIDKIFSSIISSWLILDVHVKKIMHACQHILSDIVAESLEKVKKSEGTGLFAFRFSPFVLQKNSLMRATAQEFIDSVCCFFNARRLSDVVICVPVPADLKSPPKSSSTHSVSRGSDGEALKETQSPLFMTLRSGSFFVEDVLMEVLKRVKTTDDSIRFLGSCLSAVIGHHLGWIHSVVEEKNRILEGSGDSMMLPFILSVWGAHLGFERGTETLGTGEPIVPRQRAITLAKVVVVGKKRALVDRMCLLLSFFLRSEWLEERYFLPSETVELTSCRCEIEKENGTEILTRLVKTEGVDSLSPDSFTSFSPSSSVLAKNPYGEERNIPLDGYEEGEGGKGIPIITSSEDIEDRMEGEKKEVDEGISSVEKVCKTCKWIGMDEVKMGRMEGQGSVQFDESVFFRGWCEEFVGEAVIQGKPSWNFLSSCVSHDRMIIESVLSMATTTGVGRLESVTSSTIVVDCDEMTCDVLSLRSGDFQRTSLASVFEENGGTVQNQMQDVICHHMPCADCVFDGLNRMIDMKKLGFSSAMISQAADDMLHEILLKEECMYLVAKSLSDTRTVISPAILRKSTGYKENDVFLLWRLAECLHPDFDEIVLPRQVLEMAKNYVSI